MIEEKQRGRYVRNVVYAYSESSIKAFSQSTQHPYRICSNNGYLNFSIGGKNG